MSRRKNSRRSRTAQFQANPALIYGASNAWRAADTTDNGSVTTSWVPYIGGLTLTRTGTGQAIKAAVSQLGNATGVVFNGVAAAGGYTGALGVSAAMTFVTVSRMTAGASGACALTVGGTVNTGAAQFHFSGVMTSRKVATGDATSLPNVPSNLITVSRFNAAGVSQNCNRVNASTAALAGALVGNTFYLGCLDSVGFWACTGSIVECMVFPRELSAGEVVSTLRYLGAKYTTPIT